MTIEGTNRNTDVLTAIAANDAAGIGGNFNGQDCGNIHIHNVTVVAKGDQSIALSPGIGSTGNNNCGQIIIDNATVHAYGQGISGTAVCPAIGPGFSSGLEYGNLPMVTIRNESEVHAHRGGGNADYIGYPYKYSVATGAASTVNLGQDGTCTSTAAPSIAIRAKALIRNISIFMTTKATAQNSHSDLCQRVSDTRAQQYQIPVTKSIRYPWQDR